MDGNLAVPHPRRKFLRPNLDGTGRPAVDGPRHTRKNGDVFHERMMHFIPASSIWLTCGFSGKNRSIILVMVFKVQFIKLHSVSSCAALQFIRELIGPIPKLDPVQYAFQHLNRFLNHSISTELDSTESTIHSVR
ncbi:hypothetical protein FB451DRAFT_1174230 [Mycena latifolia]|nr:hypothetical protein FB451DRAFT_1174230 [Mycena latifolia]